MMLSWSHNEAENIIFGTSEHINQHSASVSFVKKGLKKSPPSEVFCFGHLAMCDSDDDDDGGYCNLVQRYRQQKHKAASSNRLVLTEKKMNDGKKDNVKSTFEINTEQEASVGTDSDDDDLSLQEAPRKKLKPVVVQSNPNSDDELDNILNERLTETPLASKPHKIDTTAFDTLAKISNELNAARQLTATDSKYRSFVPPSISPEVVVGERMRIHVKLANLGGNIETVQIGRTQTFETLFRQMSEKLCCSLGEVLVFWEGRVVLSSETPVKLAIQSDDFVTFDVYSKAQIAVKEIAESAKPPEGSIGIKFQYQERDKTATQFVTMDQTFGFIKETFAQKNGLIASKILFIFDGDRIGDDSTPSSLELEDGDCIDVAVHK